MKTFLKRLKYYGVGFGFGLIFVFFFFKNRGCSWTPDNRVKNAILDRLIVVPDDQVFAMDSLGLNDSLIVNFLNVGDVDFGASDKDDPVKNYVIENEGVKLVFSIPYESFLSEVSLYKGNSKKDSRTEGSGTIIHIPNDENIFYIDSIPKVATVLNEYGIDDGKELLLNFKRNGKVSFDKSELSVRPKPIQYLEVILFEDTIGVKATWYKDKINVFDVITKEAN